jgi:uncharacterized protein YeaO (DUF488 family)
MIGTKRIYEKPKKEDGTRILVDRLWPRGIRKEDVKLDLWIKDVAPSNELRHWFGHDPKKWSEFRKKYFSELKDNRDVQKIASNMRTEKITLLYGARDEKHNNAVALKEFIEKYGKK